MRRPAVVLLAALAAGAAAMDPESLLELRSYLGRREARWNAFGSASTIRLLNRVDALQARPAPGAVFEVPPPARPEAFRSAGLEECGRPFYAPARDGGKLPSTALADPTWVERGLPVLSIAIERCRLLRLLAHPQARGRDWEEPAFVSYFDAGELRFASAAGLRLHGGGGRRAYRKSFRLYFRDLYGEAAFLPGIVSEPGEDAVRQLVVERDIRPDGRKRKWHFINPLAYDVARRLGAVAPRTKPAMLVLNGEPQHVYVLGERIAKGFLERRFGHGDFTLVRGRAEDRKGGLQRTYREMRRWLRTAARVDRKSAGDRFDLESLSRWFASIVFCATGDAFQAAMVRDERDGGLWRWINWDMDISFRVPRRNPEHGWQKDLLGDAFQGPAGYRDVGRGLLFRLMREDPSYRRDFAELLVEALNHRLTEGFFAERLDYYEGLLAAYEVPERRFLEEMRGFFRNRPTVVREQIVRYLAPEGGGWLHLRSPGDGYVTVDGWEVPASYDGWYLAGEKVRLVVGERFRSDFLGWRLDGREAQGPELELRLSSEIDVVAAFAR